MTIQVTSATAERVYSKVKLVKSALRSTSKHDSMSDLIQIFVESDTTHSLELSALVDVFALKPRKLLL